jgi:putative ABC transport system permease protein
VGAHTFNGLGPLYVATPAVLHRFGIDPALVTPDVDVLTPERGTLFLDGGKVFIGNAADPRTGQPARLRIAHIGGSKYGSVPKSFVTPAAIQRYGLGRVRSGWLVETTRPLTSAQLAAARDAAASVGLAVEARDEQGGLATTRTVATLAGILLALAILAMTVGLIRSESGRDLRTLTATGATSHTRRLLTAVTAGALALLGVFLGAAAAYLALVASYLDDLHPLHNVPVAYLAAMAVGVPALAALAGWLLGGREPPLLTRAVLD